LYWFCLNCKQKYYCFVHPHPSPFHLTMFFATYFWFVFAVYASNTEVIVNFVLRTKGLHLPSRLCGFDSEHLVWSVFQELAVLLLLCSHYAYVFLGTCRDLNPLHNIEQNPEYKDKYFLELLPMANKYARVRNSFQECGSAQVARKNTLATKLVCLFTPNFWLYEWRFSDFLIDLRTKACPPQWLSIFSSSLLYQNMINIGLKYW
jgi:hypothetical protein